MQYVKVIIIFLYCSFVGFAQQTQFKATFGGNLSDQGFDVVESFDKHYVAVGSTSSFTSSSDIYLLKCDTLGKLIWQNNFGTGNIDRGEAIIQNLDSGFVIAGYTSTLQDGYQAYIVKTNRWGVVDWQRIIGGSSWDFAYGICETYDSGYAVVGETSSFGAGGSDVYLIKLNKHGDTLWTETFGGLLDEVGYDIVESKTDSSLVIVGRTESISDPNGNAYLMKVDKDGNQLWQKDYGRSKDEVLYGIVQSEVYDDYFAAGATNSIGNDYDFYYMRFDESGDTMWTEYVQFIGFPMGDEFAYDVCEFKYDSSFAYVGITKTASAGYEDITFFKYGAGGVYKAATGFGTYERDLAYAIIPTSDKGFLMCGQTDTTGAGFKTAPNLLLIKMDSLGVTTTGPFVTRILDFSKTNYSLNAFPNPAKDIVTINLPFSSVQNGIMLSKSFVQLFDMQGQVLQLPIVYDTQQAKLDVSRLAQGTYIIQVTQNGVVKGRSRLVKVE